MLPKKELHSSLWVSHRFVLGCSSLNLGYQPPDFFFKGCQSVKLLGGLQLKTSLESYSQSSS